MDGVALEETVREALFVLTNTHHANQKAPNLLSGNPILHFGFDSRPRQFRHNVGVEKETFTHERSTGRLRARLRANKVSTSSSLRTPRTSAQTAIRACPVRSNWTSPFAETSRETISCTLGLPVTKPLTGPRQSSSPARSARHPPSGRSAAPPPPPPAPPR